MAWPEKQKSTTPTAPPRSSADAGSSGWRSSSCEPPATSAPATKTPPNDSEIRGEDARRVVGDVAKKNDDDDDDADARASKVKLSRVSFSLFEGMYYFSPATLIFLAFLTYVFEWDDVTDPEHLAAARHSRAEARLIPNYLRRQELADFAQHVHLGHVYRWRRLPPTPTTQVTER